KQHGKRGAILGIHSVEYPGNGFISTILIIITDHYLYFARLFMQLWCQFNEHGTQLTTDSVTSGMVRRIAAHLNHPVKP
ncbi:MAG: hypothetical protein N2F24_09260, partial [Deltaproteobacteria bacterium]